MHEDFQRQDIGRMLLAEAVAKCPLLGTAALVGLNFGHNTPSLALLARAGFARWGLLPRVARLEGVERDVIIVGPNVVSA